MDADRLTITALDRAMYLMRRYGSPQDVALELPHLERLRQELGQGGGTYHSQSADVVLRMRSRARSCGGRPLGTPVLHV